MLLRLMFISACPELEIDPVMPSKTAGAKVSLYNKKL
jgi:hypothetical protein